MYYYDTAYHFMVIFIFTYNYLHESDEMAAVCSSVFFRKAMLQTCFGSRPWRSVCVGDLPIRLMTFSLPWVFFLSLIPSPHESTFDLLQMNERCKIIVFPLLHSCYKKKKRKERKKGPLWQRAA